MIVVRLTPSHTVEYRALMLRAYALEPEAFTSTVAEREPLPLEWWESRVSDRADSTELVFGAFVGPLLVGAAGLRLERRPRWKHKATLFGTFVLPEYRSRGIGRALVKEVLDHARSSPRTQVVKLTVTDSNVTAVRLYESSGFVLFGTEPYANRIHERFVSLLHMWCNVGLDEE